MKTAKLIHNPGAGEGGPSKEELISMVRNAGYACSYQSVKEEGWRSKAFGDADFLIAAGGDGTVKKVVKLLLEKNLLHRNFPVGLLPIGTANNIASALKISGSQETIINSWKSQSTRNFDLSMISGLNSGKFFIEGFGYGIFPFLVKKLKEQNGTNRNGNNTPSEKLANALRLLLEIIPTFPAKHCQLLINGKEYEGKFLLVEVLNIPGIGPNLKLAPSADPGDGDFDVVLVTEEQREAFAAYVSGKLDGRQEDSFFTTMKTSRIRVLCEDCLMHVDDEIMELEKATTVEAEVINSTLVFFK